MRYVPRNCIQPEAVLAKPVLGPGGEILLHAGVKMTSRFVSRLEQLGINGAYVDDPLSQDLDIVDAISEELRSSAIKSIASLFSSATQKQPSSNAREQSRQVTALASEIVDSLLSSDATMLNLIDLKSYDSYTYFHCVNVTVLSIVIGMGLNYNRDRLVDLAYAALIHDIGKVFIDQQIINKRGPLTDDEFQIIKKHPIHGYEYVKDKYMVQELVARGVLDHHERVDGSGYPEGKKGSQIIEYARIIAIADVYDALISDRPYRKGWFAVEAVEYIQGAAGKHFDFDMVQIFSQKVAPFPVGTCVLLSNGCVGLVMENFEGFPQRPFLKIFKQEQSMVEPYYVNLRESAFDITIVATVEI